ncbi:MAG: hypothetical protein EP330_30675 [Deltaproteobacteria bacterium]|nr:MAG: hypothetical protein EP330_30675 [Deltaproteobacteria bacterium]
MRALLLLTLIAGCGTAGDDNPSTDSGTTDSGTTDSGVVTDTPPSCVEGCTAPSDCDGGVLAYDADNYQCDAGACIYTGCNSNAECQDLSSDYVCASVPGLSYDLCQLSCSVAADCDIGGGAAFDADNYTCTGGVCRWTGCTSTTECQTTYGNDYVCGGGSVPTCVKGCTTPADCDLGSTAYDADNYACESGACVYTGCVGNTECEGLYGSGAQCVEL